MGRKRGRRRTKVRCLHLSEKIKQITHCHSSCSLHHTHTIPPSPSQIAREKITHGGVLRVLVSKHERSAYLRQQCFMFCSPPLVGKLQCFQFCLPPVVGELQCFQFCLPPFLRRCSSLGGNLAPLPPVVYGGAVSRAASQPVKTGERIQVRFADLLPTLPTKTFHRQNSARVGATQGCIAEFLPSYLFCRGPFPCIVVALVVHHLARKPFHDSFLARTVWQGANALIPPAPT